MNTLTAIAKKELRTYFLSPIALIFIATFLLSALFSFFWIEGFFSRNVADIRPLFAWLPVLLIFLVPALGMRLWSEEERTGTMELLRTFPMRTGVMVLGKFVSGLWLVAVALVLTLPIPLMVNTLGDLDWGPVFGGYVATLLLAGAYLSITLCISAMTSSQIVALVFGAVACGVLYLVGSDPVVQVFGNRSGEVLRSLGAGSRFESILRGVIDLRDLAYYGSLIGFFLLLNTRILEARRWSESTERRAFRFNAQARVALVGLNLVALNLVLAPTRTLRWDLTEQNEYSISNVTRGLLESLDEPLLIRGYFSQKTHPLLAPLVPRIRDFIEEYGAVGGLSVRAEFVDPTADPTLEKEARQAYGIESVPFQFADRHEASVVNSYFSVLIKYGDQYETLRFDDLIEVQVHGMDIDVSLRNLEYDLTRAVQKVKYGFQSLESVLARLPNKASLTAYVTEQTLPEEFKEVKGSIQKVVDEIQERAGDRFSFAIVDPDTPGAPLDRQQLYAQYGIKPMAISFFSEQTFYMNLLLEVGEHIEQIVLPESLSEADIKKELVAALKRAGPGSLKTLGVVTASAGGPGMRFTRLREVLGQTYTVEDVDLSAGRVPGNVDVLLVLNPKDLDEKNVYAIDQFMMRGGGVIVSSSAYAMDTQRPRELNVAKVNSGLTEWLKHHGITIDPKVVLDSQSAAFPVPVTRNIAGFSVQEIQMVRYPAFVDIRGSQMNSQSAAVAGLPGVVLHWPSPVRYEERAPEGEENDSDEGNERALVLLRSSPEAWTLDNYQAQPNFNTYRQLGWPLGDTQESFPLAVSQMGPFASFYKNREAPVLGGEAGEGEGEAGAAESEGKRRGSVIETSSERSRLVVVGSSSFVSDGVIAFSRQVSDAYLSNLQLVQNLVDWCLEDVELLQIRARGTYARQLLPTDVGTRKMWEWGNYLFALLAVVLIGFFSLNRRRKVEPLPIRQFAPTAAAGGADLEKRKEGAA